MPSFPWGLDDDEEPDFSLAEDSGGSDGPRAVASSDPDDALDDDE